MGAVIQVQGLGKRYRLGESGYVTLREHLAERLSPRRARANDAKEVWALRGVDLEIDEGETVGIVGRNGAGKTTLLKTIARIVRPTTGVVRVRGRVGALLEVGTGFHSELTGRENILLNGVVLGMTRRDVRRRFDEIVEFAGVERFLDTPLKRYSTGMRLRLAFAVAAHIEPDVLIVDEVLAVGDAEFQRRCLGRMSELGREGRTVVFVSHDTGTVARLCRRAFWLEQGRVQAEGSAQDVVAAYLRSAKSDTTEASLELAPENPIQRLSIALGTVDDERNAPLRRDRPLSFELRFSIERPVFALDAAMYVVNDTGIRVLSENASDVGLELGPLGDYVLTLQLPALLPAGDYVAGVWIGTEDANLVRQDVLPFVVSPRPDDREESIRRRRVAQPSVRWSVQFQPRVERPG